jgi:glycosyltransferase involved in cell wall biosynthesis
LLSGRPWTERWARLTRPGLVIANSAFTAETTARVYPGVPLEIVHPPVELPAHRISAVNRQLLRESFGASPSSLVILQAGRFEKLKGQHLLLDALSRLDPHLPWLLWIAGEAQRPLETALREQLERRAQALGIRHRIAFLGHVSDMPQLMQCADTYCQPNMSPEAFGLTFIEALHAHLPILSTNIGGAKEILEPGWGMLSQPHPEAIAAGLHRLLTSPNLREALAEAGPSRARHLCDPRAQLESFAAAFDAFTVHAPAAAPLGAQA